MGLEYLIRICGVKIVRLSLVAAVAFKNLKEVVFTWFYFVFINELQVGIVSVAYSQSELLQKEVFLVELVDSISMSKEPMSHLKAAYYLRPTSENIQHLRRQLVKPRFGEYHLCKFSAIQGGYEKV